MKLLLGLLICSWAALASGAAPTNTVEVRRGTVFINGTRVSRTTRLAEYQKILGKPDRVTALQNIIHTYDTLGIRLYQPPGQENVVNISLDFMKQPFAFSPTNSFAGVFTVNGAALRSDFPKSKLPTLSGIQIEPAFKNLKLPVIRTVQGKVILVFEYVTSANELRGVGIAWQEGAP